jgi:hypothetical protein
MLFIDVWAWMNVKICNALNVSLKNFFDASIEPAHHYSFCFLGAGGIKIQNSCLCGSMAMHWFRELSLIPFHFWISNFLHLATR